MEADRTIPTRPFYGTLLNDMRQLHRDALPAGVLQKREKDLIALCVAVAVGSEMSIDYHVHNVIEAGATSDEVVEALDVTLTTITEPAALRARQVLRELQAPRDMADDQPKVPRPYMSPD